MKTRNSTITGQSTTVVTPQGDAQEVKQQDGAKSQALQVRGDSLTRHQVHVGENRAPTQTELQSRGASVVTALVDQNQAPVRRRRGRTGALKLMPQKTLLAQIRKPVVRAEIKRLLGMQSQLKVAIFGEAADPFMADPESQSLLEQAEAATDDEEKLHLAGEAFAVELLSAMKSAGIPKAEQSVAALKTAGLHRLLARSVAEGRVRYAIVDKELERFRSALADRTLSAVDIKTGILAFDEAAQRLALVGGKSGPFSYAATGNRARDSLITFARSLHR